MAAVVFRVRANHNRLWRAVSGHRCSDDCINRSDRVAMADQPQRWRAVPRQLRRINNLVVDLILEQLCLIVIVLILVIVSALKQSHPGWRAVLQQSSRTQLLEPR